MGVWLIGDASPCQTFSQSDGGREGYKGKFLWCIHSNSLCQLLLKNVDMPPASISRQMAIMSVGMACPPCVCEG